MHLALMFSDMREILTNPFFLVIVVFQIWMTVDAVRRQEWFWAVLNFLFGLSAILYFFMVYRPARALEGGVSLEWAGAGERERIKELEEQIHHMDKAHHHAELGGIYLKQGKADKALPCFESAYERDADDLDIQGAYGRCLMELKQPEKAVGLLEKVVQVDPKHDYGATLMALAQVYRQQGQVAQAQSALETTLVHHTYAEARVMLAEIYIEAGQKEQAKFQLEEVVEDGKHAPEFVQKKDRVWARKARKLLDQI